MFDWVLNTPMKKNVKKRNNWSASEKFMSRTQSYKIQLIRPPVVHSEVYI